MGLFRNLRSLFSANRFPVEDFHTEVVAQVLENCPKLTEAWLLSLGAILPDELESIQILTQVELPRLEGHLAGSRLDLVISCNGKLGRQIVIVESKVLSQEGKLQLQRYADHLARMALHMEVTRGALVFITRDFEIFDTPVLLQQCKKLSFVHTRWFHFYHELCVFENSDALIKQLKLLMEDNNMNTKNTFDAANILCLQHWHTTKSLMDETIAGEVNSCGQEILAMSGSPRKAIIQLRNFNRYVLAFYVGEERDLECLVGYWLEETQIWVGCMMLSNPTASSRIKVISEFQAFLKSNSELWEHDSFDDPQAWASVYRGKYISHFSPAKDQVRAIKDYFLEILEDVRCFRDATPNLPWKQTAPTEGEE